jgi:hypothetical protein
MPESDLEAAFDYHWRSLAPDAPEPVHDYRFVAHEIVGLGPGIRKRLATLRLKDWQLDRAWPKERVAVELQGGVWMQTITGRGKGHAHPRKLTNDYQKINCAQAHGWAVFQFNA